MPFGSSLHINFNFLNQHLILGSLHVHISLSGISSTRILLLCAGLPSPVQKPPMFSEHILWGAIHFCKYKGISQWLFSLTSQRKVQSIQFLHQIATLLLLSPKTPMLPWLPYCHMVIWPYFGHMTSYSYGYILVNFGVRGKSNTNAIQMQSFLRYHQHYTNLAWFLVLVLYWWMNTFYSSAF